MNILILQETDWLTRGPLTPHHIFERISTHPEIEITVLDYDIDQIIKSNSIFIKTKEHNKVSRVIEDSSVKVIRTAHIQVPYLRRISSLITNFFKILGIIRKSQPNIIIGFSMTNGIIGLLLAKIFHIPYIFFYIDKLHELIPISYLRKIGRAVSRVSFKLADSIAVHTKLQQKYVIKEGAEPKKIQIVPDGVDFTNTVINRKKLEKLKDELSIEDQQFVLLFLGYLYEFAGLKEIIDYYSPKVKNRELNLKFLILGDGGIYSELKKQIEKNKTDWVKLLGRVPFSEITEYIELADLCLMSFSINDITKEVLPIKIIEYMAMKKPVLSTALPGVVLELGNQGGIIFAEDQKKLIRKIEELSQSMKDFKSIGEQGYKLVKEKYDWNQITKDFKALMFNVIKNKLDDDF